MNIALQILASHPGATAKEAAGLCCVAQDCGVVTVPAQVLGTYPSATWARIYPHLDLSVERLLEEALSSGPELGEKCILHVLYQLLHVALSSGLSPHSAVFFDSNLQMQVLGEDQEQVDGAY